MEARLIHLLQLSDSCFPVGGYVYSYGMESAINAGHLNSNEEVKQYLITFMEQVIDFDFPFIDSAYSCDVISLEWIEIMDTYEAMIMNPLLNKSSVVLGKNWFRLVSSLYDSDKLVLINEVMRDNNLSDHYVPMLGKVSASIGITLSEVREMHLYMTLRDQVTALNRLGTIGPMGGQQLMVMLLQEIQRALESYQTKTYKQAYKSAYLLDMIQLNHKHVYSKLFQN